MFRRLLHLVDQDFAWEHQRAMHQLQVKLADVDQAVCALDGRCYSRLRSAFPNIRRLPSRELALPLHGYALRRLVQGDRIDALMAWGHRAWRLAATYLDPGTPVVLAAFDPILETRTVKALRTILPMRQDAVACASGTVRRRLIEQGVPAERCVIIRPGVDFAAINLWRRKALEWRQRHCPGARVIALPTSIRLDGAAGVGAIAASVCARVDSHTRILPLGMGPVANQFAHVAGRVVNPAALLNSRSLADACELEPSPESLLAAADVLLVPVHREMSTTLLAWAMASSVLVLAAATYSVCELISHGHNGLLVKPGEHRSLGVRLAAALVAQGKETPRLVETARGQAFEVFGIRRYADQSKRLFENLFEGLPLGQGIGDSSLIGVATDHPSWNQPTYGPITSVYLGKMGKRG